MWSNTKDTRHWPPPAKDSTNSSNGRKWNKNSLGVYLDLFAEQRCVCIYSTTITRAHVNICDSTDLGIWTTCCCCGVRFQDTSTNFPEISQFVLKIVILLLSDLRNPWFVIIKLSDLLIHPLLYWNSRFNNDSWVQFFMMEELFFVGVVFCFVCCCCFVCNSWMLVFSSTTYLHNVLSLLSCRRLSSFCLQMFFLEQLQQVMRLPPLQPTCRMRPTLLLRVCCPQLNSQVWAGKGWHILQVSILQTLSWDICFCTFLGLLIYLFI